MNIKWAIAAVLTVLAAMAALPGLASAHHPVYSQQIECTDGSFTASLSYIGGPGNRILILTVNGDQFDGTPNDLDDILDGGDPDGSLSASHLDEGSGDGNFNFSGDRDRWESDGAGNRSNFFVLQGNYDDVDAADSIAGDNSGALNFQVEMYGADRDEDLDDLLPSNGNPQEDASPGEPGLALQRSLSTDDFWEECESLEICIDGQSGAILEFQEGTDTEDCDVVNICVEGDALSGTEFVINQLQLTDTDDCGMVQLCYEGEDMTVTEHELENNPNLEDVEKRACIPQEDPNPEPDPEDPAPPVDTPDTAVAEVAPAVDIIAALPAAGNGGSAGGTYTWIALFGLVMIGLGATTTLMVHARK